MKLYMLIDSDGWTSETLYREQADAVRKARNLITMDGWDNTDNISVYEIRSSENPLGGGYARLVNIINRPEEPDDE